MKVVPIETRILVAYGLIALMVLAALALALHFGRDSQILRRARYKMRSRVRGKDDGPKQADITDR